VPAIFLSPPPRTSFGFHGVCSRVMAAYLPPFLIRFFLRHRRPFFPPPLLLEPPEGLQEFPSRLLLTFGACFFWLLSFGGVSCLVPCPSLVGRPHCFFFFQPCCDFQFAPPWECFAKLLALHGRLIGSVRTLCQKFFCFSLAVFAPA